MSLPVSIYTLALDAIRFLPRQLEIFEKLNRRWNWHIVSGVADNVLDTGWCAKIPPRLSRDGTDEFLNAHMKHPNITIQRRQLWPGKTAMVNAALSKIKEPCVLMEIDADEMWRPEQIEKICQLFETGKYDKMSFFCRYFVGENLIVTSENGWGNRPGEWLRGWMFKPGMIQARHEPPVLSGCGHRELSRMETRKLGLVFDHEAYKYEESLIFKEQYYRYKGAVDAWKRLQVHNNFPCRLNTFFAWVDRTVIVDRIRNH